MAGRDPSRSPNRWRAQDNRKADPSTSPPHSPRSLSYNRRRSASCAAERGRRSARKDRHRELTGSKDDSELTMEVSREGAKKSTIFSSIGRTIKSRFKGHPNEDGDSSTEKAFEPEKLDVTAIDRFAPEISGRFPRPKAIPTSTIPEAFETNFSPGTACTTYTSVPGPLSDTHTPPDNVIRKYSNELVQAREEIGRLQGILALEAKAGSSAKHDMERRHMELLTVLRDLEARLRTAERRSRRDTDEIKRLTAKMDEERSTTRAAYQEQMEKVQDLLGQRKNLKAQVERLTKPEPSLDVFDNSVDQVSESYIKSHGQPSLDGLNYAIDNLIQNALTDVEHFMRLHQQDETVENSMDCDLFGVHQNHPLLVGLGIRGSESVPLMSAHWQAVADIFWRV